MYEATRIFTSNLNAAMAQRFFNLVLLPRIRDDILDEKKLNFHLCVSFCVAFFQSLHPDAEIVCTPCVVVNAIVVCTFLQKSHHHKLGMLSVFPNYDCNSDDSV